MTWSFALSAWLCPIGAFADNGDEALFAGREVQQIVLVFATAYLGNPSSMFGHTLLRLDSGLGERNPLLSYAVNFAAQATDAQGVVYAWKGLTGGYLGRFGILPYYDKVAEYARIDNRDLWEYRLNFSRSEKQRLLKKLEELGQTEQPYYFLTENCSYQLLLVLEAARPELNLRGRFGAWVSPVDTLRVVQGVPGLVDAVEYRPSLRSRLAFRIDSLTKDERKTLSEILAGQRQSLPEKLPPERAALLAELVHDWARYQQKNTALIGGAVDLLTRERLDSLAQRALRWRAAYDVEVDERVPSPVAPDQGHPGERYQLSVNWSEHSGSAAVASWRPVLHSLLEAPAGYPAGSEIEVLNTQLSYGRGELRVHEVTAIRVDSRPLRDEFFKPYSWQVELSFGRRNWASPGVLRALAGWGGSWRLGEQVVSLQAIGQAMLGPNGMAGRGLALGLEGAISGQWSERQRWRLTGQVQDLAASAGSVAQRAVMKSQLIHLRAEQQWDLTRDLAVQAYVENRWAPSELQAGLAVSWYFDP